MLQFVAKLFGGDKSKKDIALIQPLVVTINEYYEAFRSLENDALRRKTFEFKQRIQEGVQDIQAKMTELTQQIEQSSDASILDKEKWYQQIEMLRLEKNKRLEEVLLALLPEAFAVVKESARRFSEGGALTATATDLDRELAAAKDYIQVEDAQVTFQTTWTAGGNVLKWNMVHYDVQLIGGTVLHQGKIAEMATGEGKTLVSTLPAYLNALAGEGVHIITVNDYLAKRDCEWNAPLFEWLGLRVACIDWYPAHSEDRKKAYRADITYGTNNEFGFDYLRDNMVSHPEERVQPKWAHFAMVDEIDSVLIDDARTPLIISGPVGKDETQEGFKLLKPMIERLVEVQKKFLSESLVQAKQKMAAGQDAPKEGGLDLYRVYRGLPKSNPLIKYLSEPGVKAKLHKIENFFLADNQKEMKTVDEALYFYIDEKNNSVDLTEKGLEFLSQYASDKDFFVLPDFSTALAAIDRSDAGIEEKEAQKEAFIQSYSVKSDRVHTLRQLLKAYTLFDRDIEYIVINNEVKIVDEQTGRVMEGRRYSDGLHQALEAKEGVTIEGASQTYATITLQNYFRMYHKLAGMTGTAQTEATEFWQIYKLDVVCIPTNVSVTRKDHQDLVYKTKREKYKAVIDTIDNLVRAGRPVLVGTTSVEVSELLSRMLQQKQIAHNVLNAKQHSKEAHIVAEAGQAGKVTIATNMAGRGTDIKLGAGVKESGGLAILGTERHESRRVDRQLRGRSGRQGDPGSSQFFISLEDDLMRMFGSDRIAGLMDRMGYKEGEVIQHSLVTRSIERAQRKVEENNFGIRKRLLEYDDVMNKQRQIIYKKRSNALFGDQLSLDLDHAFYHNAQVLIEEALQTNEAEKLSLQAAHRLDVLFTCNKEALDPKNKEVLVQTLYQKAVHKYGQKKQEIAEQVYPVLQTIQQNYPHLTQIAVPITDDKKKLYVHVDIVQNIEERCVHFFKGIEKNVSLIFIDEAWKEHLKLMDDLRQSVQNAVYEQKDPLVIYKGEAFNLFCVLNEEINRQIVMFLSHAKIAPEEDAPRVAATESVMSREKTQSNRQDAPEGAKPAPVVAEPKIGRNTPCPCGSGKKYKHCHGK